jgi:hypothetical protein
VVPYLKVVSNYVEIVGQDAILSHFQPLCVIVNAEKRR